MAEIHEVVHPARIDRDEFPGGFARPELSVDLADQPQVCSKFEEGLLVEQNRKHSPEHFGCVGCRRRDMNFPALTRQLAIRWFGNEPYRLPVKAPVGRRDFVEDRLKITCRSVVSDGFEPSLLVFCKQFVDQRWSHVPNPYQLPAGEKTGWRATSTGSRMGGTAIAAQSRCHGAAGALDDPNGNSSNGSRCGFASPSFDDRIR